MRLVSAVGTATCGHDRSTGAATDTVFMNDGCGSVIYAGPVKRSVMIAGHATSISLEPLFWDALKGAAGAGALPLSALVARIDAERIGVADPPNLASAIRLWLFAHGPAGMRDAPLEAV